jgi:hypothetical protein
LTNSINHWWSPALIQLMINSSQNTWGYYKRTTINLKIRLSIFWSKRLYSNPHYLKVAIRLLFKEYQQIYQVDSVRQYNRLLHRKGVYKFLYKTLHFKTEVLTRFSIGTSNFKMTKVTQHQIQLKPKRNQKKIQLQ